MPDPLFRMLSGDPDKVSPSGDAEIRDMTALPEGEITHAVCLPGTTSKTHLLPKLDEAYYVLAGTGEIWRATDDRDMVTALRPGRWVGMPAGTRFQYRTNRGQSLVFLVMVLPQWRADLFGTAEESVWTPGRGDDEPPTDESELDDSWMVSDLPYAPNYQAPDTSEIRLLGAFDRGSLAECVLHPGHVSFPVRHRTVREIWYVTTGHGDLWRSNTDQVVRLWPGISIDIQPGAAFQFRSTGADPLRVIMLTMPRWPGPDEADPVPNGRWPVTAAEFPGR